MRLQNHNDFYIAVFKQNREKYLGGNSQFSIAATLNLRSIMSCMCLVWILIIISLFFIFFLTLAWIPDFNCYPFQLVLNFASETHLCWGFSASEYPSQFGTSGLCVCLWCLHVIYNHPLFSGPLEEQLFQMLLLQLSYCIKELPFCAT